MTIHADRDLRTLATLVEARITIAGLRTKLAEYEETSHGHRMLDDTGRGQGEPSGVGAEIPRQQPPDGVQDRRLSPARTHKASEANKILRHCLRRLGFTAAWKRAELTGHQILELLDAIREYGRAWLHHEAASFIAHYGRKDVQAGVAGIGAGVLGRGVAGHRGEGGIGPLAGRDGGDSPRISRGSDTNQGHRDDPGERITGDDAGDGVAEQDVRESLAVYDAVQGEVTDAERIAEPAEPGRSGVAGDDHPEDGDGGREGAIRHADSAGLGGKPDPAGLESGRDGVDRSRPVLSGAEVTDADRADDSDRNGLGDAEDADRGLGLRQGDRSHSGSVLPETHIRSLSSAVSSHVGRFFTRAKGFVHELILAGAMALNGPAPLDAQDVIEVERQAQVQAQYFDRFHREMLINPPAVLSDQPAATGPPEPMTPAEFAARAEQYGNSAWSAAHNVERNRMIRIGYTEERRVLHPAEHCTDCPPLAALGWQPIGTLPAIGETECRNGCRCSFSYRDPRGKSHGEDRHGRKVA